MANITLRSVKASPLTNNEIDNNFIDLNNDAITSALAGTPWTASTAVSVGRILYVLTANTPPQVRYYVVTTAGTTSTTSPTHTSGTTANGTAQLQFTTRQPYDAVDVLDKLRTVDGDGSGLDADLLDGRQPATANTPNTIVLRDGSGNFSAGTISGTFSGVSAITSGTITGITDLAIADGGTGASTAVNARTNLGLAIGTDVQAYDAGLQSISGLTTAADRMIFTTASDTYAVTPLTATARSLLDDADVAAMRTTLGVVIGSDVQPFDGDLSAIAGLSGTGGFYVKTAANAAALRTVTAGTGVTVTNGDGVAGNPIISIGQAVATTDSPTFNNLTVSGNLTINGTTTTINSTTITVDDINIELGSIASPTDTTANGGGITLRGTTNKTINWLNSSQSWTSSENIDLASTKSYRINNVVVLSATQVLGRSIGGTTAGDIVSIDATQTLTNKTLTSATLTTPRINDTSATHTYIFGVNELAANRTITLPLLAADDTFVFQAHTQTLTNKTFTDSTTFFQDDVDNTKRLQFQLSGIATGTTRTLTAPNNSGTIALVSDIGTATLSISTGAGITTASASFGANATSNSSITISHADTSSVPDIAVLANRYLTGVTFDTFGHVQTVSTSTIENALHLVRVDIEGNLVYDIHSPTSPNEAINIKQYAFTFYGFNRNLFNITNYELLSTIS
jgi:hypothetical protein